MTSGLGAGSASVTKLGMAPTKKSMPVRAGLGSGLVLSSKRPISGSRVKKIREASLGSRDGDSAEQVPRKLKIKVRASEGSTTGRKPSVDKQ